MYFLNGCQNQLFKTTRGRNVNSVNKNMTEHSNYVDDRYEGCGQEGPIRCIFLCEFHPVAGPKITCQVNKSFESFVYVRIL